MRPTTPADRDRLMRWATYASAGTAATLIAIKLAAWTMTGSVALLSTLIDSVIDAAASLVNIWAVRHALMPMDQHYRFGRGKAEPLAGLGQAAFIVGAGMFLLIEAADRALHPTTIVQGEVGIVVMVISIILTLALVKFQRHVIRRTESVAISADSLHYAGDVLINLSVIVSMLLSMWFGWGYADPIFAAAIAGFLIWNARAIAIRSLKVLMDRELPDQERQSIRMIAMSHQDVRNVHDLRTRQSGIHGFIQLHLELDGEMSLNHA
ncbi:MAG: cation diffusion facilitator family transporter, partial [Alphaproteobacteria bacterium]|nr:cation diffusion facilitator family transporter [Alphaproteobacteria bacterium]